MTVGRTNHNFRRLLTQLKSRKQRVTDYWTQHNVTLHKAFATREESLNYFHWRCDQYPGYLSLMPVDSCNGLDVLDYGCGPGHDLVGFLEYSRPATLTGADVSPSSLAEAEQRVRLHGGSARLVQINQDHARMPFEDRSFDYIHSSGVLHHLPNLPAVLKEFKRIMRPGGRVRAMIYNYDSLWMHLYVAYILRYRDNVISPALDIREAFSRSTDGPDCPIANCYTFDEFSDEVSRVGFSAHRIGVACALFEMQQIVQDRYRACMDLRLEREHRDFLLSLTFDERGTPYIQGVPAGVDLVVELQLV